MPAPQTSLLSNYRASAMNSVNVVPKCWLLLFCYFTSYLSTTPIAAIAPDHSSSSSGEHYAAYLKVLYETHQDNVANNRPIVGYCGYGSLIDNRKGIVVHVRSANNKTDGCSPIVNVPRTGEPWIALIQRGDCTFQTKITNAAIINNASAVVIYNNESDEDEKNGKTGNLVMNAKVDNAVSVFIRQADGEKIATLADKGTKVTLQIEVGKIGTTAEDIQSTPVFYVNLTIGCVVVVALVLAALIILIMLNVRKRCMPEKQPFLVPGGHVVEQETDQAVEYAKLMSKKNRTGYHDDEVIESQVKLWKEAKNGG